MSGTWKLERIGNAEDVLDFLSENKLDPVDVKVTIKLFNNYISYYIFYFDRTESRTESGSGTRSELIDG